MKRIEIEEITSYGFSNVDDDETIAAAVALGVCSYCFWHCIWYIQNNYIFNLKPF